MYELTGRLGNIAISYGTGKPVLTVEFDESRDTISRMFDELKTADRLTINIAKYRKKRSLNANNYLWQLCTLIAGKLSDDGEPHTKEDIYRDAIKAMGIYREQGELPVDFAKTSRTAWEMLGTGWITEQVDFEPDGNRVIVRYYYGSSTYNTKQMARVIDWLTVECRQLGIETRSKEEIDSLLQQWGESIG